MTFKWSYSALSDYEQCPAKYKYRHVERLPEEKGPALTRGTEIHQTIEDYITGKRPELPEAFDRFKAFIDEVKAKPGLEVEGKWALARGWKPTEWKAPDAWWRGKLDVFHRDGPVAHVVDWKTGKIYPTNRDQMRLYAGVVFAREPEVEEVHVDLIYLDAREGRAETYTREHQPMIVRDFDRRTARIEEEKLWAPRGSNLCKYCSYAKAKGGPCSKG